MFNWQDENQVGDSLWGEHKKIEDHIVPQPREPEEKYVFSSGECCKSQINENAHNDMKSNVEILENKHDYLICDAKRGSGVYIDEEITGSSLGIDVWPELPTLSTTFGEGFNVRNDRDSMETRMVSDLADASHTTQAAGFMAGYDHSSGLLHHKGMLSSNTPSVLFTGYDMEMEIEPELFQCDGQGNIFDYDWPNIEDFDDLDKMFRSNEAIVDDTDTFVNASANVISSSAQSIPFPAGMQNETPTTSEEDKGNCRFSHFLDYSWHNNENPKISDSGFQASSSNTPLTFQSLPEEHFSEFQYAACPFPGMPLPPKVLVPGALKAYSECSKLPSQPMTIFPPEKIEELRQRKQMQAMVPMQKQSEKEQYIHQISGVDITIAEACLQNNQNQDAAGSIAVMEDHTQKFSSSDVCSFPEQDQSLILFSPLADHSVEEVVYYQLQDAMEKLDMKVRISICDSLYRLAKSAMERQNASERSCSNKTNKEEDVHADEESNNQERYMEIRDSEVVTNPIDRIIAHLLFHNPSGPSLMPISDGHMAMAASM